MITLPSSDLMFHPLTADRWDDVVRLFGERGACGGCWCMYWRLSHGVFQRHKGQANRDAFRELVAAGDPPGILAYIGDQPVGWCAVAPREALPRLERSRLLKKVDDTPVWSVVCFFIAKTFRQRGVSVALLRAAIPFVRERGGQVLEGYPVVPKKDRMPDVFAYTGTVSAFTRAGFVECIRRSETRPIMRYTLT